MYIPQYLGSAAHRFDALLYPPKQQSTIDFLNRQLSRPSVYVDQATQMFEQQMRQRYEEMHSEAALDYARQVNLQYFRENQYDSEYILPLATLDDFQMAGVGMQRWLMANPYVRDMYHRQRCDGYSDTYIDDDPEQIGMDHYDYRRIMDGVMVVEDDNWYIHHTDLEELRPGDRYLTSKEKMEVITSWNKLEMLMAIGKDDPTSRYGDKL